MTLQEAAHSSKKQRKQTHDDVIDEYNDLGDQDEDLSGEEVGDEEEEEDW